MWSNRWIKGQDYPEWADADVYKKTITGGYLFNGETPRQAYKRVADTVAMRLKKPEMADKFFEYIWNGWLCLASPVLSNTGTEKEVYLYLVLVLMLLIAYMILARKI